METPPHFSRFDPEKSVTIYRRNLPHWRQDGATYFVTFRLADSIPKSIAERLRRITQDREAKSDDDVEREWFRLYETTLDQCHGNCLLRAIHHRQLLHAAVQFFNEPLPEAPAKTDVRMRLGAFVIMPNHLHLLIQPTQPEKWPLEKILQSVKRYTAQKLNERLVRTGEPVWAEESYDRIVRDGVHLQRCLQYIGRNPAKANLGPEQTDRWVSPIWKAAGWKFRGNR